MSERTIFLTALDKDHPSERKAYLDGACAGQPALRRRVEALLKSHDEAGSFLDAPIGEQMAVAGEHTEVAEPSLAAPGENLMETQAEVPPAAESGLDFLSPSAKPGSLGRLDHYEVLEVIGRGGMGVVLKAFDEVLHRVVAVKVLAPQLATNATARKRFIREAQAGAAVCHDHVVTIHAVDEGKAVPYLVMQCVAGLSLQEKLDRTGPLGLKEILRIGLQTAEGLAAAHKQGLVHRDIKPANILLENGVERVKITDFGLARAVDDASITQSGVVAGTPQYMSPEQAQGEAVDHRSDLFSLGSVLYAMCTGRPPFRATGSMAVLKRVCEDTPRPIREINPEIPDWLCNIIAKLHAKKPVGRFQSATEVGELLSLHLAHLQQPTLVPPPAPVFQASAERQSADGVGTVKPVEQPVDLFPPIDKKHAGRVLLTAFCVVGLVIIATMYLYSLRPFVDGPYWLRDYGPLMCGGLVLACIAVVWLALDRRSSGRRKLTDRAAPSKDSRAALGRKHRWARLIAVLAFSALGIVALIWLDYTPPAWWRELWTLHGQPDQTPGSVSITWNDPDVVVVLDKGEGNTVSSRQSPLTAPVNPGMYKLRALKGEQLLFEENLSVAAGAERVVDLSGFVWPPLLAKAPFTAEDAKKHQAAWAKHLGVPVEIENAIGMKFRLIPPGEFLMGSTQEEIDPHLIVAKKQDWRKLIDLLPLEMPRHSVRLTQPFYLGMHEVTQGEYQQVMETNPSHFSTGGAGKDRVKGEDTSRLPVEHVAWLDAVEYCNKLSKREQRSPCYRKEGKQVQVLDGNGYRLPTEAEWEFACRAGSTASYCFGDDAVQAGQYAWLADNAEGRTHPVGQKLPNAFGLFDMHGNVWECCQDWFQAYQPGAVTNPRGPSLGTEHVTRGGSWDLSRIESRCSYRGQAPSEGAGHHHGVRVVLNAAPGMELPSRSAHASNVLEAWMKSVGALPAKEQVKAVAAKLKELNPGFDGSVQISFNDGVVTQLELFTDHVTDISPVRALTGLKDAAFNASRSGKGKLADLSPLRGLPLRELVCDFEPSRDAFVLRSMKTLEKINGKRWAEFWMTVDGPTVTAADCLVRAWEFAKADKWTEAEAEFWKAADAKPDDPQVLRWRGVIKAEAKHLDEAAADFNKALELAPWNTRTRWTNRRGIDDTICQWDDVFTRVADLRPMDANLWIARTRWFAQRGKWKEAADASAEVLKRDPEDAEHWFMDAPLRLQIGEIERYRRDCQEMLTRFSALHSPERGDQVAKTCLLLPDAVEDRLTVVQMADRALVGTEKQENYPWFVLCRALAHYRARESGQVIEEVGIVLKAKPPFASIEATARSLLAMTMLQSGQLVAARAELQQSRALLDKTMPRADRGERFGDDWHDWLRCQILFREAERLIEGRQKSEK